ncbi:MAG: endolytic transglycosylase MltG [Chitinophagaceae bacterium]
MKKIVLVFFLLIFLGGAVAAWLFFGPATGFTSKKEALYISSKAPTKEAILDSIENRHLIKNSALFSWLANQMKYWTAVKPGKYEIEKGSSLFSLVRKLRNGQQTPVNLVITKLRTKEDLARAVGRRFETDSAQMMQFLNNADALNDFGATPETAMWNVLPDTYTFLWNTSAEKIYAKLADESKKFWTPVRKSKATTLGLSTIQAYILASIIEEETTNNGEKDTMASVYLNRIKTNMPLQADPTVKFALHDFGLKRILQKHWKIPSPYNTYLNRGLPPGPICTPGKQTIEAVLNAPNTKYLYFVANKNLKQSHIFTTNYADHLQYAREYQQVLDSLQKGRDAKAAER